MKPSIQSLYARAPTPWPGNGVASRSCDLCPLIRVCIPHDLDVRETRAFEHVITRRRRVDKGQSVVKRFDKSDYLHIVRFGQFKRLGHDINGNERVTGFEMAADIMGLDAFAQEGEPPRFLALEDSEVCEIPVGALLRLMNTEPTIQRLVMRAMSQALQQEYRHAGILASTSLDARFAAFLLELGSKFAHLGYAKGSFRLSMSRSDMASYLGTALESVSRLVARFNVQGSVAIDGRFVALTDRAMLEAIMRGDRHMASTSSQGRRHPPLAPAPAVAR